MTVLILTNNDVGLYRFRRELIERLSGKNRVLLALPNGPMISELEKSGGTYIPFEFYRRGTNPFADIVQIWRYIRLIRRERPDVVLTYTIKPNVYGGLACQLTKTPHIANITGLGTAVANGGLLGALTTALYRMGLKKAGCVFFQNASQKEFFLRKRLVPGKTRLIPGSGVNLETHCAEPYPPSDETTKFLFVGRIMRDKGIEELLRAMRKVAVRNPHIFLDIVGESDEDYSQALSQIEQEGLAKYHGLQIDVHSFYRAAHCVLLPSYHEGTSNVLLEAASTARPIITTRIPGCMETFDEGITGFGCNAGDADSLAAAMETFLALPQADRERMGKAGREKMAREFDRLMVLDAYEEEIQLIADAARIG